MNYDKVLVVGVNSSIASIVLPELDLDKKNTYGISHSLNQESLSWIEKDNVLISSYPLDQGSLETLLKRIIPLRNEKVLVLNFAGIFGTPAPLKDLNTNSVLETVNQNLSQFLSVAKIFFSLPSNSFLVGFSGGGVGGDNMDATSLGYLLSKISLAGVVEVLDRELKNENKRITLIAPGPFPSAMQEAVSNAPTGLVSNVARKNAQEVQASGDKLKKLAQAINWVSSNPQQAGGKIWSAQRDDFSQIPDRKNFGFLRRVTD
jgi:short-subunit dehydrogenase